MRVSAHVCTAKHACSSPGWCVLVYTTALSTREVNTKKKVTLQQQRGLKVVSTPSKLISNLEALSGSLASLPRCPLEPVPQKTAVLSRLNSLLIRGMCWKTKSGSLLVLHTPSGGAEPAPSTESACATCFGLTLLDNLPTPAKLPR